MKVLNKVSIFALATALLVSPVVQAGILVRYLWSDSKGFVAVDSTCHVQTHEKTPLYIVQKPGAELNSYTKLKGTGFFSSLIPGNLLDRSVVLSTLMPVDNAPASIKVISVPRNAIKPSGVVNVSKRGDEGSLPKETLQEIGNFVIEVLSSPVLPIVPPFQVKESYWQAAMDGENYIALNCGDAIKSTNYVLFDVYDSKGIFPIAQVGISGTDNKVLEDAKVLTPDEANQDAIGEAPESTPTPAPPVNGGTTTPGTNPGGTPGMESPEDGPTSPEEEGEKPGVGYLVCTTDKAVPVLDKDLKPIGTVPQFEVIIPNQTWDEKQKSSHLEVQFPNRKDITTGWLSRDLVQTQADCVPYQKRGGGNSTTPVDDGVDYSVIPLDPSVSRTDCCKFPTQQRPSQSYAEGKTRFRASRAGGKRLHAGVDLYRKKNDAAMAVASGRVIRGHYYFYQGVFAVEVKHPQFIARYGEVLGTPPKGIAKGKNVVAGQTVGLIGKVNSGCCVPMLHFELYKGTSRGPLSRYRSPPYDRRPDVMDPTALVRQWEKKQFGSSY